MDLRFDERGQAPLPDLFHPSTDLKIERVRKGGLPPLIELTLIDLVLEDLGFGEFFEFAEVGSVAIESVTWD